MELEHLMVKVDGPVTRITLNHPERRNPLSLALMLELASALRAVEGSVVILEGAGPCFSAGHDLAEMAGRDLAFYTEVFRVCTVLMETIQEIPQPVIAKVHGFATAAGCQLVAACDLAVATDDAWFATPGVKIGLFCSTPMVEVSRAVGRKRAMEMLLTSWKTQRPSWPRRSPPPAPSRWAWASRPSTARSTSTSARPMT
jgi:enoyl-CoA hydratase/carnithine racemase